MTSYDQGTDHLFSVMDSAEDQTRIGRDIAAEQIRHIIKDD